MLSQLSPLPSIRSAKELQENGGKKTLSPEVDPALQSPYSSVVSGNASGISSPDAKGSGLWIVASVNLMPTGRQKQIRNHALLLVTTIKVPMYKALSAQLPKKLLRSQEFCCPSFRYSCWHVWIKGFKDFQIQSVKYLLEPLQTQWDTAVRLNPIRSHIPLIHHFFWSTKMKNSQPVRFLIVLFPVYVSESWCLWGFSFLPSWLSQPFVDWPWAHSWPKAKSVRSGLYNPLLVSCLFFCFFFTKGGGGRRKNACSNTAI